MNVKEVLKKLKEAKHEHCLRDKHGEVAVYDALIWLVEIHMKKRNPTSHIRRRTSSPTALTWEEKNPTDYIYRPSRAMKELRRLIDKKKKLKCHSL